MRKLWSTHSAIRREPSFAEARIVLAASLGYLGRIEEARTAIDDFKDESVEFVQANRWYAQDFKNRLLEGLRKAELID